MTIEKSNVGNTLNVEQQARLLEEDIMQIVSCEPNGDIVIAPPDAVVSIIKMARGLTGMSCSNK